MVWYSLVSESFSQFLMIHSFKGFSLVDETETAGFLKFPCFLCNPVNVGNLIYGFSSFSKHSLNIWKFLVHIMLKSTTQDFKRDLPNMGDECKFIF